MTFISHKGITLYIVCSVHREMFRTSGGYHEYIGDTMSTSGDTMSTSGDTMSTSGDTMSTSGDIMSTSGDNMSTSGIP